MAQGLKRYTVQEALQPYVSSVTPAAYDSTNATTQANTTYKACRGVVNETDADLDTVTLTFPDKTTVVMSLNSGVIYPICAIRTSSAGVTFLY
tara:strand:+ start:1053 stop:1331 length:279 start_codon:yes stop_codon:yes gene_type:complete